MVEPVSRKHYRHYTIELFKEHLADSKSTLEVNSYEYVFRKPFWYGMFKWLFENHLFCLEVKPLMLLIWKRIWEKYRFARSENGLNLFVFLKHKTVSSN
jgi:hypothetical protein